MKYRPSRSFMVWMSLLTLGGAGGAWAWNRIHSVPMHVRVNGDLWEMLTYSPKPPFVNPTPEEIARSKGRADQMAAEAVRKYPILDVEEPSIPEERNGYLRMHRLTGSGQSSLSKVSPELRAAMKDGAVWDTDAMRPSLDAHRALLTELLAIGRLDERSSRDMPEDYTGFISAREIRNLQKLMLHAAKLAAVDGDRDMTLSYIRSVYGIAGHYREVGSANLMCVTVALLVEGTTATWVINEILPALGPGEDLALWRELIGGPSYDSRLLAKAMRGEWHYISGSFMLPVILLDRPDSPQDPDALIDFMAGTYSKEVEAIGATDLAGLDKLPKLDPASYSHLSKKSRELARLFTVGWGTYGNGLIHYSVRQQLALAALDLIALQRSGADLSDPAIMDRVTKNPVTGKPFVYDARERVVSAPSGQGDKKPPSLRLP